MKQTDLFMGNSEESPLLIWSGGIDSTYILWQLCQKYDTVYTKYIEIENNTDKTKFELYARNQIIEILQSKYDVVIKDDTYNSVRIYSRAQKLQQFIYASLATDNIKKHDLILFGFHKEDDFFKKLYQPFLQIFKNAQYFWNMYEEDPHFAQVGFPLREMNKYYIINQMSSSIVGSKLLLESWVCEYDEDWLICPGNERCQKCEELRNLLKSGKLADVSKKILKHKLDDWQPEYIKLVNKKLEIEEQESKVLQEEIKLKLGDE